MTGRSAIVTVGRRLREREFWVIQVAIVAISIAHVVVEAGAAAVGPFTEHGTAAHILVILYLAPVAYAGLLYGWEGGVLTGVVAGALATINLFVFSLDEFEWVLELVLVVVVVGMGIVMALPVERERRQRRLAEAAADRLEALNQVAGAAVAARTASQAAEAVLRELVDHLELGSAGLVVRRGKTGDVVVSAVRGADPAVVDATTQLTGFADAQPGAGVRAVHFDSKLLEGHLVVPDHRPAVAAPDADGFLTAVGTQIAVRVENAMLLEQEQANLTAYARLVTEAQEEERRRLARDLHDGPAQQLAFVVRSLDGHDALHGPASDVLAELRRVARDQRPTLLDDLGLVPALEWLCGESDGQDGRRVELQVTGSPIRLDPTVEVACYRIVQEAIRNAERHAGASHIRIDASFEGEAIRLSVTDDGIGFEVPDSPGGHLRQGRLGLMGMHERAQLVGGRLEITSGATGTTVTVEIPDRG